VTVPSTKSPGNSGLEEFKKTTLPSESLPIKRPKLSYTRVTKLLFPFILTSLFPGLLILLRL
jgi:hypothetical protein